MSKTNNALATMEEFSLAPINCGADLSEAIAEELGTMGALELSRVKFPSGGGIMFTVKHDGATRPESAEYLDGVILHHHSVNAYWREPYTGGNIPPDCSSMDGITGMDAETGECQSCANCPYNQFESEILTDGTKGRGKACKNGHRIYMLRDGEYLPILITLPPTGLKAFKSYLQGIIIPRRKGDLPMRSYQVITRIGLTVARSGGGAEFGAPTFEALGIVPAAKLDALRVYAERFKAAAQRVPVTDGAYAEGDDDDLPDTF